MVELSFFEKFIGIRGLIGIGVALILGTLLGLQKLETHHWESQSTHFEQLYHGEEDVLTQTVANYKAALIQAKADDKANTERVLSEQQLSNTRTSQSYEARIADLNARLGRLRASTSGANPGSPGNPPVPGNHPAPGGADGATGQDGLSPDDAYLASKQAIQLDELQKWVTSLLKIDRNSPPSSPKGSH